MSNREVSSAAQKSSKPDCTQSVLFKVLTWPFSVLPVGVYNNQDTIIHSLKAILETRKVTCSHSKHL